MTGLLTRYQHGLHRAIERREPVILCGDFNALPTSSVCRRLAGTLKDVQTVVQHHRQKGTYSGRFPTVRIDHIYISPGLDVTGIEVPTSELARVAADHLPLVAEIRIPEQRTSCWSSARIC